jgi:myo-inositol catabolism protein IolS
MTSHASQRRMDRRPLGARSGLEVSEVGLGLWAVSGSEWGPVQDEENLEAIEAALESGVTFFDTADVYGGGHSEELLGRAMRSRRESFIVATKIGWIDFDGQENRSQYDSVDTLVAGVQGSLHRLGTDSIDVIQCHVDYPEPNTQVFIDGFRALKEAGTVRAWGVSTSDPDHLRRFNADGDCDVLQTDYSLLNRTAEEELLPYCQENGIGVIVRGPLAMGLLTGKYSAADTFPPGDFRRAWIEDPGQHEQFLRDLQTVDALREVVPDGQTMAQFALRFVRSNPAVSTVIPGAKDRRQAESNSAAGLMPLLSDQERAAVDRLVPPAGGRKIWPA